MRNRIRFHGILILIGIVFLQSCSRNPVTGKREIILMSTDQEIALGQQSHPSIIASMGLYEDKKLQSFITEKGMAMAKISHRPDLPYQFNIIDSPVVNAFAVPGGYVYFTRGIMAHFNNEAEFAGVLGHEIGHVTARHSARQQTSQILGTVGLIAGMAISPKFAQFGEQAMQGLQMLMLSYSRAHESESDKIGVEYSSKVGYDAHQMANFFGTIKRISDNSGQSIPNIMSTHPDPGDRFNNVHAMATDWQAKNAGNYAINRDSYLQMINGIVYGEDPKQGFVENNVFYHPELRFQFPVPADWQTQNSPEQLVMAPKDGKSGILFNVAQGKMLDSAAQNVVKQYNLKVLESTRKTINGNPAIVIVSQQIPQPQQGQAQQPQTPATTVQIGTWLIQYNGLIYAMHGLSTADIFPSLFPTFKNTAENFRSLSDPDKLNRKPERIFVKSAPRNGTFKEIMSALGMPASRLEELGVVNSMKADTPIQKGMLVKVIGK
ncbi:M48 family metalloprotease [Runella sp.]|uniref:M48 family metalloprotease n=1 Tax=Runella sp. TaxID=1960881 RepID=UPI003D1479CD